jgi:RNA polymerase sigma-70 factor, ECF subfamily
VQATASAQNVAMTDAREPAPHLVGDSRSSLLRHREGDPDAFGALVTDYRRPVYSYLIRCGVAEGDRDDLFQVVFLKIHRAASQYRAELPAHPWIFTIVANEVRSYLRRRRVRELVFAAPGEREPEDMAPGGEREAQARETVAWLEHEIRQLPLAQREVLILVSLEGRPLNEVASVLGLPLGTVKTHLRRARILLAHKLARHHALAPGKERT